MKADDLLDLIGNTDEKMIAEAKNTKKSRKNTWVKWGAMAACLCLVVIGSIVAISTRNNPTNIDPPQTDTGNETSQYNQTDIGKKMPQYNLSALDIASLFPAAADRETNQYTVVYARSINELCGALPEASDTIDIYTLRQVTPDPDKARTFLETNLPFLKSLASVSTTDYDWQERTDAFGNPMIYCSLEEEHIPEDGEGDEAWTLGSVRMVVARNQYSVYAEKNIPLTINDTYVGFPASASDEEIRYALTDTVRYFNDHFGTDYSEIKISRDWGYDRLQSISVFLYDGTSSAYPEIFSQQPLSGGCITLTFYSDWGEGSGHDWSRFTKDELLLGDVSFYVSDDPWDEVYSVLGTNRMLSLEEAEEMLSKGYVFGGHSCPLCIADQEALDFSDYDGVEIEYIHSMDSLIYVPFYAFYKEIGENEYGMPSFAKTYVCAVEVSGLDDYFEGQEVYH